MTKRQKIGTIVGSTVGAIAIVTTSVLTAVLVSQSNNSGSNNAITDNQLTSLRANQMYAILREASKIRDINVSQATLNSPENIKNIKNQIKAKTGFDINLIQNIEFTEVSSNDKTFSVKIKFSPDTKFDNEQLKNNTYFVYNESDCSLTTKTPLSFTKPISLDASKSRDALQSIIAYIEVFNGMTKEDYETTNNQNLISLTRILTRNFNLPSDDKIVSIDLKLNELGTNIDVEITFNNIVNIPKGELNFTKGEDDLAIKLITPIDVNVYSKVNASDFGYDNDIFSELVWNSFENNNKDWSAFISNLSKKNNFENLLAVGNKAINTNLFTIKSVNVFQVASETVEFVVKAKQTNTNKNIYFVLAVAVTSNTQIYDFDASWNLVGLTENGKAQSHLDLTKFNIPEIKTNAFNGSRATEIKLSPATTAIGNFAFAGCSNLMTINGLESTQVTTIPTSCFSGCRALNDINLNKIQTIEANAFNGAGASGWTVNLPAITNIADNTVFTSSRLTNITLGNSITSLPNSCFSGLTNLQTVELGAQITSIPQSCFSDCSNLTTINLDNITNINTLAFKNAGNNRFTITLPKVVSIASDAFRTSNLYQVTLGNEISSLNNSTFKGNTNLKIVSLGSEIHSIPNSCFEGCTSLTTINLDNITTINARAFYGAGASGWTITLPKVTSIAADAFSTSKLQSITLGETLNSLQPSTFRNLTTLQTVNLGSRLTTIPDSCFEGCTSLTTINLDNITTINARAFYGAGASGWTITLPKVTSIAADAFSTSKLQSITLGETLNSLQPSTFRDLTTLQTVNLGSRLTTIPDYCFEGCTSLTRFDFADITTINTRAFYGAFATNYSLVLPSKITTIQSSAFENSRISNLSVYSGAGSISFGDSCFKGCSNLTSVSWGSNKIPNNTFQNCTRLRAFSGLSNVKTFGDYCFNNTVVNFSEVVTGSITLGRYSFSNIKPSNHDYSRLIFQNVTLINNTIPEGCFENFSANIVFTNKSDLVNLKVSNTLPGTSIGNNAFRNSNLSFGSDIIPSTLLNSFTNIGSSAFYGVQMPIQEITLNNGVTIGIQAFSSGLFNLQSSTIYNNLSVCQTLAKNNKGAQFNFTSSVKNELTFDINSWSTGTLQDELAKHQNAIYLTNSGKTTLPNTAIDLSNSNIVSFASSLFARTNLASIVLPQNLTNIPNSCFEYCNSLTTVDFTHINAPSFVSIGDNAFGNSGLTSVDLSRFPNLKKIGKKTFYRCQSLLTAKLPPNIIELYETFYGCRNLNQVGNTPNTFELPSSVNVVSNFLNGNAGIKKVIVLESDDELKINDQYSWIEDTISVKEIIIKRNIYKRYLMWGYSMASSVSKFVIGANVTSLSFQFFDKLSNPLTFEFENGFSCANWTGASGFYYYSGHVGIPITMNFHTAPGTNTETIKQAFSGAWQQTNVTINLDGQKINNQ